MLLFDQEQIKKLKDKNSVILITLTEEISDDVAACFNTKFNRKMDRNKHPDDKRRHFFSSDILYQVLSQKEVNNEEINIKVKKIAFVFLFNEKNDLLKNEEHESKKNLTIVVIAIDGDNKFMLDFKFESSKTKNGENIKLSDKDFNDGMSFYREREMADRVVFDPCKNAGVMHEPGILKEWLDALGLDNEKKNVRIYLGIDDSKPSLQVPMLVDNTKEEINTKKGITSIVDSGIFVDEKYALDRGNGCCPEQ